MKIAMTYPKLQKSRLESIKEVVTIMLVLALFGLILLGPEQAFAQTTGSSSLPWESFTQRIACTLTGPWVKWAAVIAVALGGVMFGLGELSGPFQKTMQIAGGFSIAIGAVTVVGWLLPGTNTGSCSTTTVFGPTEYYIQTVLSVLV